MPDRSLNSIIGDSVSYALSTLRYLGRADWIVAYDGPYDGVTETAMPNKADGSPWAVTDGWVCNYSITQGEPPTITLRICIGGWDDVRSGDGPCCPPLWPPYLGYSTGSTNSGDQVAEDWLATVVSPGSYMLAFSAHKDDEDDPQHPIVEWEWYQFDNIPADTPQQFSHIVSDTAGGDWRASAWALADPGVTLSPGGSFLRVEYSADGWSIQHVLVYAGVGSQPASAAAQGTGTAPSVTVATQSGDLVVGAVFCPSTGATITDGADQTRRHRNTGGFVQRQMASSDKVATGGSTTLSWALSSSLEWSAVAVVLRG